MTVRRGETVPASVRADRSREATKQALARELAYAGILARVWPSYITEPIKPQPGFPFLLCVDTPAGLLVWRVNDEEVELFRHLPCQKNDGRPSEPKVPMLLHLASEGW